ncbi:MAG: hypothetical protein JSV53_07100 [candidate division WOR-3 bacterium]|nr:MAG: hypothetical protein JSV53_07100 [candidate division WOR-3 bacterium]
MTKNLWLIFFIFLTNTGYGQIPQTATHEQILETAREHYENGAYAKAITQLETILPYLEDESAIEAHVLLAFNYVSIGDEASAIEHFKAALTKDPELQLDRYEITPKIAAVYEEATKEKAYESAGCSCFIPGIGQILKGDYAKGRAIIAASGVTLGGTLLAWSIADGKYSHYLSLGPDDYAQIEEAYDEYNRWRKITFLSAAAFTGVYIYSIIDAMIARQPSTPRDKERQSGIILKFDGEHTVIGYAIKL